MPAAYVQPDYVLPRNGQKPVKDELYDLDNSLELFAGDGHLDSAKSSMDLAWLPGNGNGKKLRAELNGNGSYY